MPPVYFEDVAVGDVREFGRYEVTADEIVEFAERYDPQSFHVDPEAAEASLFGGLAASGWHTASMTMRMLVDGFLGDAASMGALGIDDLRWHRPVRPGDVLSIRTEVLEKRPSESRPGVGIVRTRTTTLREDGDPVQSFESAGLFAMRDPDE